MSEFSDKPEEDIAHDYDEAYAISHKCDSGCHEYEKTVRYKTFMGAIQTFMFFLFLLCVYAIYQSHR